LENTSALVARYKGRVLWAISLVVLLAGVLLSISRAAVLICAVMFVYLLLFGKSVSKARALLSILFLILAIPIVSIDADFSDLLVSRFPTSQRAAADFIQEDSSARQRVEMQAADWQIFLGNFFFGIGSDNIPVENERRFGVRNTAEQVYVEVLAENGVVGAIGVFLCFWALYRRFSRAAIANPNERRFTIYKACLLCLLLIGLFAPIHMDMLTYILLGAIFSRVNLSLEVTPKSAAVTTLSSTIQAAC
jgi:O-antigen ligase